MTIEQAMELIHGVEWRGSRPGLSRVRELLHRLGDPQDGLQFVHIAGTNGKGSTAAMLASILRAAGYTTGLFTSPYLERFAERMQVNGAPVPDAEFAAVCQTLQPCIAAMDDPPTEFELVTAAAHAVVPAAEVRCCGAGGRSRRPARRDERHRRAGVRRHHEHWPRPHGDPRRHARADRAREGGHPQARHVHRQLSAGAGGAQRPARDLCARASRSRRWTCPPSCR